MDSDNFAAPPFFRIRLPHYHYIEFEKNAWNKKCESASGAPKYKNQDAARVTAVNKSPMRTDISKLQSKKPSGSSFY